MRARIENNVVVEVLWAIPGFTIDQCFHPDLIARSVSLPIDVEQGWTVSDDGVITDTEGAVQYQPPAPPEPKALVEESVQLVVGTPAALIDQPDLGEVAE